MAKFLLLMKGLPGTGKSTTARLLARTLAWPLIDKDDIKDELFQEALSSAGESSYEILFGLVERQLDVGLSVVCDSPLSHLRTLNSARDLGIAHDATVLVIETIVSDETLWRERIEKRQHDPDAVASGHRITSWEDLQAGLSKVEQFVIDVPHLQLDTSKPEAVTTALLWEWLAAQGVPVAQNQ